MGRPRSGYARQRHWFAQLASWASGHNRQGARASAAQLRRPWVLVLFLPWLVRSEDKRAGRMDSQAAPEQPGTPEERRGLHLTEVSNAMVRIYKEQFGRGPTK